MGSSDLAGLISAHTYNPQSLTSIAGRVLPRVDNRKGTQADYETLGSASSIACGLTSAPAKDEDDAKFSTMHQSMGGKTSAVQAPAVYDTLRC